MSYQIRENLVRVFFEISSSPSNGTKSTQAQETIFVIDYSGSMAGSPWKQVLEAVKYIQSTSPGRLPTFILYDHAAAVVSVEKVLAARAQGGTSFQAALTTLWEHISAHTKQDGTVSVVFMTDGQQSVNEFQQTGETIRKEIAKGKRQVALHTIGFGQGHDRKTLDFVRSLGNMEGTYRYVTGTQLEGSFAEMFDFLDVVQTVAVAVEGSAFEEVDAQKTADGALQVDWIFKKPPTVTLPDNKAPIKVQVRVGGKKAESTPLDVAVAWTEPDWLFEIKSVETMPISDVNELKQAQAVLAAINPAKFPRLVRDQAWEMRMAVQQQLDKYAALFADAARGTVSAENMVGQLQSMRYDHRFAKARRARAMNMRATSNATNFAQIQSTLETLKASVTEDVLKQFRDMDYKCVLTGDTVYEMMAESTSDIMMFGLCVQRPEYVVDAPSMVRVEDVLSGTYTSDAIICSIRFALTQNDAEQVHGGFSQTTGGKVGYFIGPDGKPMNACLPLYINATHFERIKPQLAPLLGFFFTLDPMGFKPDQYLALYTIYGQMLAMRAKGTFSSEWANTVIENMANLCEAVKPLALEYLAKGSYASGKLTTDPYEAFIKSPAGRAKEVMQSLYTVIGWAMASFAQGEALSSHIRSICARQAFTVPLMEEMWRRQLSEHYKSTDHVALSVTEQLMYGPTGPPPAEGAANGGMCALSHNDSKKEKQFEAWARFKLGVASKRLADEIATKCKDGPESEGPEEDAKYEPRPLKMYGEGPQNDVFLDWLVDLELAKITENCRALFQLVGEPEVSGQLRWLMLVQAMLHLRDGEGSYPNTLDVMQDPQASMRTMHEDFERHRKDSFDAMQRKNQDYITAQRMAQSSNLWAFTGRLMKSCPTRGGSVFDNLVNILASATVQGRKIPNLKEKVRAVLTGRLPLTDGESYGVLAGGVAWPACPQDIARQFKAALGDADFTEIELSMVGRWGWVYRESDIPNRHGHCNSNPNPKLTIVFESFHV